MERYADALLEAVRDTEYAAVDITEQGYLNITLPVMMPQRVEEGFRSRVETAMEPEHYHPAAKAKAPSEDCLHF